MNRWHIGEILIRKRLIDWGQLEEALTEQKRTRELVGEVLIRKNHIPKFLLFKALAEKHAMAFVDLSRIFIDPSAVERVPRSVAVKYGLIPIGIQDSILLIGISDPRAAFPRAEIAELAKVLTIRTLLCTPEAVKAAIAQNYDGLNVLIPSDQTVG